MLSLEDLVDLGEALRRDGFRVATPQYLAANQLLLRIAADGVTPPRRLDLASYLGPVFCTNSLEQRKFEDIYRNWLRRRFADRAEADCKAPQPPRRPIPPVRPFWLIVLLAAFTLIALAGAWFSWQQWRPRIVVGTVVASDGTPAKDAEVSLGAGVVRTGTDGAFRLGITGAELPLSVSASLGNRSISIPVAVDLAAQRARFYLGASLGAQIGPVTLTLPADAPRTTNDGRRVEEMPRPEVLVRLDASRVLPAPNVWDRVDWSNLISCAVPLLAWLGWLAWWLAGRPVLQRMGSRTPPQLREVHLTGGVRAVLPGFPLRRLAQELRRRRTIESNELQVEPTIQATLRNCGIYSPVRGSRVEPDYLVLIDRTGASDHQALLAGKIVAELGQSDVLIERYDFERDATLCRPREVNSGTRQPAASARAFSRRVHVVELAELLERYPEHRVMIFSDGAGCFDGYSGEPVSWLTTLLQWSFVVLLTPLPLDKWGRREWALQQLGVSVLPLSQDGLVTLMNIVGGASTQTDASAARSGAMPGVHERTQRRWLERDSPPPETVESLCRDLRADLGPRGWTWVAACAAYPELHWGITLRLGAGLVPDRSELERLLPRVVRLVWFREAYMPDWLRVALLERIEPKDRERAREILQTMLEAVTATPGNEVPLRIAIDESAPDRPLWRRVWDFLRTRSRQSRWRDMLRTAPPDSPLRDYVFLRFITGRRIGKLAQLAPMAFLHAVAGEPRRVVSTAGAPGLALALSMAVAAALVSVWPPIHLGQYKVGGGFVTFSPENGTLVTLTAVAIEGLGEVPYLTTWRSSAALEWQPTTAELPRQLVGRNFSSGALGANGRTVALGDPGLALVENSTIGMTLRTLDGNSNIDTLAFDGDSRLLGAGGRDGSITVWSVDKGTPMVRLTGHTGAVTAVAFAPGGKSVASGSADGTVRLWNLADGRETDRYAAAEGAGVSSIAIAPDGKTIAVGSTFGRVTLWDVASKNPLGESLAGLSESVRTLVFSPDGRTLAGNDSAGAVFLWGNRRTPIPLPTESCTDPQQCIAFDPDGKLIAVINKDGVVTLFSVPTSAPIAPLSPVLQEVPSPPIPPVNSDGAKLIKVPPPDEVKPLPALNIDIRETSISGFSSGAFMAVQFQVAHSSIVKGAGIVEGGPYFCSQGDPLRATMQCSCTMDPGHSLCSVSPNSADVKALIGATRNFATQGLIDDPTNLARHRILILSGDKDQTIPTPVADQLVDYYTQLSVPTANLDRVRLPDAGHTMPTVDYGTACGGSESPYLGKCRYDGAKAILEWIYGPLRRPQKAEPNGQFIQFDQRPFIPADRAVNPWGTGLDSSGWIYTPDSCAKGARCRLHIALHGCRQGQSYLGSKPTPGGGLYFGTTFIMNAGYIRWADDNNLVLLFPQAISVPGKNPNGCWDWWGYTGESYADRKGLQIRALRAMVDRLSSGLGQ